MLIKCPKCDFSQPQDQYCAQCGIDMISFKRPHESAVLKVLKDPVFHIGLVLIIAIASSMTIYKKQKNDIEQRVTYLRGSSYPQKVAEQYAAKNEFAASSIQEVAVDATGTRMAAESQTLAMTESGNDSASEKAKSVPSLTMKTTATKTNTYKVKVIYAEVSARVYEALIEEAGKSNQYNNFGDYSAGIIPIFQKKISNFGREFNILRTDLDPIDIGKSLNWTFNYRGNEREPASLNTSYSTFVNLEESENQIFKGNLEIVRSQKESVDPALARIQKSNYPAVFEMPQDAAFFMSGLGSHHADGIKSESEFIVLVQFEKVSN